ncbi:MAG TPA: CocE/NonD family hydrolase [Stellaceae bacterium]|nr:CocE/NonD family hydrolase [Stellaceae bacterium]
MRLRLALALLLACAGLAEAQQAPGPVGSPSGPWREQMHWIPLDVGNARSLLSARVCRPAGEAPARVVVIAHGSPPLAFRRPTMAPAACNGEAARWFLDRGFVVVAAMRRGYGSSGGNWAEGLGGCENADFRHAGLETARDLAAIVDYAASLPFARPQGIVLVGQSAGGWGAIAYDSLPHPRVSAIVNMAGGRGGHRDLRPNTNCRPDLLAAAAGAFGRGATTPMLWIYTANDSYFAPSIAAAMYDAYTRNGGRAEFYPLGPYGSDGHRLFFGRGGSQIWGPLVERYLASRPAQ